MTEPELLKKLNDLQTINGIQLSKIKALEEEVKNLSENARVWAERYRLLKLYGPDRVDDGEWYNTGYVTRGRLRASSLSGSVKILSESSV